MRAIILNLLGTFTGLLLLCLLLKNFSGTSADSSAVTDSLSIKYPYAFNNNLKIDLNKVNYYQAVDSAFQFSEDEKELLQKSGLAVSGRMSYDNFGKGFYDIFQKEVPVFLPADCFLYAIHQSYNIILEDVESDLNPVLQNILQRMIDQVNIEKAGNKENTEYQQALSDLVFYLQTAQELLTGDNANQDNDDPKMKEIISRIMSSSGVSKLKLFGSERDFDFSFFKLRGPYIDASRERQQYFRAMVWLGNVRLLVEKQRDLLAALILADLMSKSGALSDYQQFNQIINQLVGVSDNIKLEDLYKIKQKFNLQTSGDNQAKLKHVTDYIKNNSSLNSKINDMVIIKSDMDNQPVVYPNSFALFGTRFVPDSYMQQNLIFDKVANRKSHKGADVAFVLGHNGAEANLKDGLKKFHYAKNLEQMRIYADSSSKKQWNQTAYTGWLQMLKGLAIEQPLTQYSDCRNSKGWSDRIMSTMLSGWTLLRHDNILYAKQAVGPVVSCYYPEVFVEPAPEFFRSISVYSVKLHQVIVLTDSLYQRAFDLRYAGLLAYLKQNGYTQKSVENWKIKRNSSALERFTSDKSPIMRLIYKYGEQTKDYKMEYYASKSKTKYQLYYKYLGKVSSHAIKLVAMADKEVKKQPLSVEDKKYLQDFIETGYYGTYTSFDGCLGFQDKSRLVQTGWFFDWFINKSVDFQKITDIVNPRKSKYGPYSYFPRIADVLSYQGTKSDYEYLEVATGNLQPGFFIFETPQGKTLFTAPVMSYYEFGSLSRMDDREWAEILRQKAPQREKWTKSFITHGDADTVKEIKSVRSGTYILFNEDSVVLRRNLPKELQQEKVVVEVSILLKSYTSDFDIEATRKSMPKYFAVSNGSGMVSCKCLIKEDGIFQIQKIKYSNNDKLSEIVKSNQWQMEFNSLQQQEIDAEFIFRAKKVR